ncbi:hypothetical protein Tco_0976883 [Tanacetum coccineum]|uniref:Reverse transcriptase domain-containing protein n=1 Tax=Tanacetum coccineum TaxID=301880 RepID=A0ABQ5EII9_9ASTR
MRFPERPSTSIKLMLFLFSLEEICRSFYEVWDRFNDLLRACPHHTFSELHQLDTFYNALNANDQDSLNSIAGGNFLDKMPRECLKIIESKSKVRNSRNKAVVAKVSLNSSTPGISPDVAALTTEVSELKNMMKTMLIDKQKAQAPVPVKAVEQSCVTCGGTHSYRNCPATDGNVYRDNIQEYVSQAATTNFNQGNTNSRPPMVANQIRAPVSKTDFENYVKANDAVLRNMQNQGQGSLLSNTVTNPKEDLKGITTRSGVCVSWTTFYFFFTQVVERRTEPVVAPVSTPMPNPKPSIPYPSRRNDEKRRQNANEQKEKFYEIFKDMKKLSEMARTLCTNIDTAVLLNKLPEFYGEALPSKPDSDVHDTRTSRPFDFLTNRVSDFLLLEEAVAFLALADDPTSPEVNESYYDPDGDILIL